MKSTETPKESTKYQAMLSEVEQITRDISTDEIDLDELVEKIEHGYSLLKKMRERLDVTKQKLEKISVDSSHETSET